MWAGREGAAGVAGPVPAACRWRARPPPPRACSGVLQRLAASCSILECLAASWGVPHPSSPPPRGSGVGPRGVLCDGSAGPAVRQAGGGVVMSRSTSPSECS